MPTQSPIIRAPFPGAARGIARHHQKKEEYTDPNPKRFRKAHGTFGLDGTVWDNLEFKL